jgi:hypothetical protein
MKKNALRADEGAGRKRQKFTANDFVLGSSASTKAKDNLYFYQKNIRQPDFCRIL